MEEWDEKFLLGIGILFGWCIVICLCASPQLFREWLSQLFCCNRSKKKKEQLQKIKAAQERVRSASRSFLATSVVTHPSQIVVHQATAPLWPEPIPEVQEDSRAPSLMPDPIRINNLQKSNSNSSCDATVGSTDS